MEAVNKTLRGWMAALLTAALLLTALPVSAEVEDKNAAWFYPNLYANASLMYLLTDAQLDQIGALSSQEVHALVEAMFLAAAGVEEKEELALWKTLKTAEERETRSAENAAYREKTLPWLMAVLSPGNRPDAAEDAPTLTVRPTATPEPTPAPTPVPTPVPETTPEPDEPAEPAWQIADAMAAFEGNPLGQAYLSMLAPLGGADGETCLAVMQAIMQRWLAEIDHDQLSGINSHYQFWLYAAGTPIDYPVVQCGNNSYYLDHMFNRKTNKAGTLFMDYRNLTDFRDPNTLIYGHHMRDSSMFHSLTDYESRGFFEAHPFMVASCRDEIYVIEVFAGYVTDGSDHCYDIAISDAQDMQRFVEAAEKKSDFDSHVEIDCGGDHLVTLSTCAYNFENARYIVIGRLDLAWERNPLFTVK